jgi:Zn-dependent protease with chaperone function
VSVTDREARRYHRWQLALSVIDLAVTVAVLGLWLETGAARTLARALAAHLVPPGVVLGMAVAVAGSCTLATAPLDVAGGFLLPRRAGLLSQPFGAWLLDRAKMLAIGSGLGLVIVESGYLLLRWSPVWWWLWSAAGLVLLGVVLAAIVPVWLVPLFYRVTPLEDPDLRGRLLSLARRMEVAAADVAVADFSRKGRTANAAVVGLGRTRRILVSDTLLARFTPGEVEVVLAHELAHHARAHVAQGLLAQGVATVAGLLLLDRVLAAGTSALGLAGPADPAGLPLLALAVTGLGLLATPPLAAWSRRLEREADHVALETTRDAAAFVTAMERLADLNLAERRPHPVKEWLFATHPSIERRVAAARRWMVRQPGPPAHDGAESAPAAPAPGRSA